MLSFKEYLSEQANKPQVWHAAKDDIIKMWKNLKPTPIQMAPIPENQKGTRLKNDGIRITGSANFINSVLSRIKDVLVYDDNPGSRLDLEYRQIPDETGIPSQQAYLCYIHAEQDLKKKVAGVKEMENPFDKTEPKTTKSATKPIKTVMPSIK